MSCRMCCLLACLFWLPVASVHAQKITKPLAPEEQIHHFQVPADFKVELVAADPLVINPITMTLDEKGWIYVSESHTYRYGPSGSPVKPFSNPVICLRPKTGGGYERVTCAEGFEEPVMGLMIRDGKLWCTANNFLYQFDLAADGRASNKKTILVDKNKAWNPFGMFVLEDGPDGNLYLSVGNHNIDIGGPTNRISGRGGSGIVLRMKPDGSDLERLVHGLRVPYSFEFDPFGQLWVLSNGEGNPNRFVRVIDGVDYHCYSRGSVDNNWLAGRHELAPPTFELPSGAHTQLMRYYGAAYPSEYQGSLLLDNWGAHGFNGANRAVFRYGVDEKGNITAKEMFVGCKDPHFRPAHIALDPDGNLLVADWYGRDDESDRTGRIWRIRYTGSRAPKLMHAVQGDAWKKDDYVLSALGSPHHLVRDKAMQASLARGEAFVARLSAHVSSASEPLGAANALWCLLRLNTAEAKKGIASGGNHSDWRVRRLALNLARRHRLAEAESLAKKLARDEEPAVRVEAALSHSDASAIRSALVDVLQSGAAKDAHLRYEAAWHLARHGNEDAFTKLLSAEDPSIRLAGLIAIDIACYENFSTRTLSLQTLAKAISDWKGTAESDHVLTLARLNGDKGVMEALEKLVQRNDVSPSVTARALLMLRAKAALPEPVLKSAGKRFLEAVEKGSVKLPSSSDQLLLLELLESEGPTPFALKQAGNYLNAGGPVRAAAHGLVRKFGVKASPLSASVWPRALDAKVKLEDRVETVSTLARIDGSPSPEKWERLLHDTDPSVVVETIRWWRMFKDEKGMKDLLIKNIPVLLKKDEALAGELAVVLGQLGESPDVLKRFAIKMPDHDRKSIAEHTLTLLGKLSGPEKQKRTLLGRQVFDRAGCVKCHTTVTQNTPLAPSLKGIATSQKADYLVESILFPSKVIKTGYETELVSTRDGRTLVGLVKEEGAQLRILMADKEIRVAKEDVEDRRVQKLSLMPEDQERVLSRQEFADLIAYLQTLK